MSFKYLSKEMKCDLFKSAVKCNNTEVLKLLHALDEEIDVSCDENLFKIAIHHSSLEALNFLVQMCNVDPCINKNEAFVFAIERNSIEAVKILLEDSRIITENIIATIINLKRPDILKSVFIDYPDIDPSMMDNEAVIFTSIYNTPECLEILLKDTRIDPTVRNNELIRHACSYNYIEIVKLLIQDNRVDLYTGLRYAIKYNKLETVKLLVNSCNQQALNSACFYGYIDIVKEMLKTNYKFNRNSAIKSALKKGHYTIAWILFTDKVKNIFF